jgi:ribosomal protein L35
MLRTLVRPLRVFLSGGLPLPVSSASLGPRLLPRGLSSLSTPLPALASRLPSLQQPILHLQQLPRGAVRWGSRKAGSTGFKTKSSIKKRFRITGGGALRRLSSGKRHLNLHKSSSRIHRLGAWRGRGARFMRQPHGEPARAHTPLSTPMYFFSPLPLPLPLAGAQKTIKNKGLRKSYLRVFGLSPFHK